MEENKMKRLMITSLILIFLSLFTVNAQDSLNLVLDLEQSVAIAMEKNPGLKTAEKEYKRASAGVLEGYSLVPFGLRR